MIQVEYDLLKALKELEAAPRRARESGERPDYRELFARIDRLEEQLPPDAPGELRHFLRKKSYEKARMWLESQTGGIERGACLGD